jgi:hypothetical protein
LGGKRLAWVPENLLSYRANRGCLEYRSDGALKRVELLQEAGYSEFSLEQLAAVRRSATFRELRGKQPKDRRQAEHVEFVERYRDLLIAAGVNNPRNFGDLISKANTKT